MIGVAIACTTISLGAQDRTQTRMPTGTPPAVGRGGNQTVKITGCVARNDTNNSGATSTTGRTSATDSHTGYMLTHARMSNDSPTGTAQPSQEENRTSAPGTPRSTPDANAANQHYMLSTQSTDMQSHVGHQVEITGRLDVPNGDPRGVAGTSSSSATANGRTAATAKDAQTLYVESVRMVATTCAISR
jgi:hypothetical protein